MVKCQKRKKKNPSDIWLNFVAVAVSVVDWVMTDDGWFQEECRLSLLLQCPVRLIQPILFNNIWAEMHV